MRYRIAFAMMSVAMLLFILGPESTLGQGKKGKGGGGFQGGGGFGGPGGFGGGGFGKGGFGGGGGFGGQGGNPMDAIYQMAESDFRIKDRNGDGFLNMDEMPSDLKAELGRWDQNRDN